MHAEKEDWNMTPALNDRFGQRCRSVEDDMENDGIIPRVLVVLVPDPILRSAVKLDVSPKRRRSNADGRVAEIRAAVIIESSRVDDLNRPPVGCPQAGKIEKLTHPDVTEKSFVDVVR
jgi:hypothetical protein